MSLNHAYANTGKGRRLTREGRDYKTHIHCHVRNALRGQQMPDGRLRIDIHLHGHWDTQAGAPRRRDPDNHNKLILDAVCAALGIDDCWIRDSRIRATHDPANPRIEIELEAL